MIFSLGFTTIVIFIACVVSPLEGRVCTRVRAVTEVKNMTYPGECHHSFEDKCSWFSVEKCIFNETVPCLKVRSMTVTLYRIVEDCCPGYHKNRKKQCVGQGMKGASPKEQKPDGEDLPYTEVKVLVTPVSVDRIKVDSESGSGQGKDDDKDEDDDNFFLGISHGAYAGIICGILFLACVALLTAVHYRKRKLQQDKKATMTAEQEAAQRQHMIPMETIESPAPVTT